MNTQLPIITLILSITAVLTGAYAIWQIISLNRLRKTFFSGSSDNDLENVIIGLKQELRAFKESQALLELAFTELKHNSSFSLQKFGLVRFNPFNDGGGNFSFSLALLDEHNSGTILTSMYGREQNRIYTKKVDYGKCDTQLTDEEQQAVTMADNKFKESRYK